jgi:hypothetical protein
VYGPILQQISSTSELNTSNGELTSPTGQLTSATILDWLTGNKKQSDIPEIAGFNWVDVRDGM